MKTKKPTKKQRLATYKKCLNHLETNGFEFGCVLLLKRHYGVYDPETGYDSIKHLYPEFYKQRPKGKSWGVWWVNKDVEPRIKAFKAAIKMIEK
jgi:hypothetical protein